MEYINHPPRLPTNPYTGKIPRTKLSLLPVKVSRFSHRDFKRATRSKYISILDTARTQSEAVHQLPRPPVNASEVGTSCPTALVTT